MSHFFVVKAPFLLVKSQSQTTIMNYIVYIYIYIKQSQTLEINITKSCCHLYNHLHIYNYIYICMYIYVYSIFSHLSASPGTPWAQHLLGLDSAMSACAPPRAARRRRELLAISFSRSCQPTRTSRFRGKFDLGISDFFGDNLDIFWWHFIHFRRNGIFPSSILMVYL